MSTAGHPLMCSFMNHSILKKNLRGRNGNRWLAARAPVVSYETLMAMKRQAGRDKDLLDIQALKKLDPYR